MLWRLTMSLGNKSLKIDPVEDLHWFKEKLIFSVHQPMYGTLDFKTLLWMEHQFLNKVLCTCIFKHCLNVRFSEYVFYVLEDIHALSWNERKAFLCGAAVGFRPLPGWEANALAFTHHHLWMVVSPMFTPVTRHNDILIFNVEKMTSENDYFPYSKQKETKIKLDLKLLIARPPTK